MSIVAADLSVYSTGGKTVSVDWWKHFVVDLAIVGLWTGNKAYDNAPTTLANARAANKLTGAYFALSEGRSGREHAAIARLVARDEWDKLSFCAIDCELPGITIEQIVDAISEVIIQHMRPILYTREGWWKENFGGTTAPDGIWLWNAYYDDDPDTDYEQHPYAGIPYSRLAGEQYTDTKDVGGIGVCFSLFDPTFVRAAPNTQVGLVDLRLAWESDMRRLIGAASVLPERSFDVTSLALTSLYFQQRAEAWKNLLRGGK